MTTNETADNKVECIACGNLSTLDDSGKYRFHLRFYDQKCAAVGETHVESDEEQDGA